MIPQQLHEALDRATDAVEPVGMAGSALATARRRRTRRHGIAAGALSALLVVGVVTALQATRSPGSDATRSPAASSSASGDVRAPDEIPTAPTIPADRIQPAWDPRNVAALPAADLGLPAALPPADSGAVTTAVALFDGDDETLLVGQAGARSRLELPAGLGPSRSVSLSPDGRRVAAVGGSGLFWRELAGGSWRRVDVPARVVRDEATATWLPGSEGVVLQGSRGGLRVDLQSGSQELLPQLRGYAWWAAGPDGRLTYLSSDAQAPIAVEQEGGGVQQIHRGHLESLQRYAASATSLAAARADGGVYGGKPAPDDRDGLIALDLATLSTRAFLPVPTAGHWYSDGGHLTPLAWLGEDTVLFSVTPQGAVTTYLVTWDVESGELASATRWPEDLRASFATELLGG